MTKTRENFDTKIVLCSHHVLGAQSAIQRFSGILNVEIPRSVADDLRALAKSNGKSSGKSSGGGK